ncbi:2-succinyl-5-enolpyruvyl-6-hydroxy-3-cyclohexene-1-carboxylic-acid synthase [uncultured Veillonella sp.]|uniref:2-succinyl-5-enolpyruvyl-6-hydroxy-3- cyclohexene-1-carboxylic-acid synthase n=1 Tax=uncultured Veillonella sp. TaxID=159268 RepID=UPI0026287BBE|nr:2-succinyl-5-enolpyruvyl-6-hydroxy-3-cyclohexene-1-carboxylic-acid synthase [uncultured Veillonella sp.]
MNEYLAALVDELYTLGMKEVVFSAGSRSTSLAMLFTAYGKFKTYMNVDERSAAFFALGIGKSTGRPVGLVCTSGSAGTHYFPAVVEAKASHIPLVMMTADRPSEMQFVGAPQTIDQMRLFGEFVNHFENLEGRLEDFVYPRQVAQRAVLGALGSGGAMSGPVQINVPLREPLVPALDWAYFEKGRNSTLFQYIKGHMTSTYRGDELRGKQGIILAGPYNEPQGTIERTKAHEVAYVESVLTLAKQLKAPVLADPLSPVRQWSDDYIIDSYDAFLSDSKLKDTLRPDYIIMLGQLPVSKRVHQFLKHHRDVLCLQVDPSFTYRNGMVTTNRIIASSVIDFVAGLTVMNEDASYASLWQAEQESMRQALHEVKSEPSLFEGRLVHELQGIMPEDSQVVVANSMAIRDFDYFWSKGVQNIRILGNRGVNGIDGTISTALGVASTGRPTVLVTGDLSFIHDINGLLMGRQANISLTIVLFNNDGGGIFEYLPQKGTAYFDYLFATPQGVDFKGLSTLFAVDYEEIQSYEQFKQAVAASLDTPGIQILEIKTGRESSCALHRKYTVRNYE